MESGGQNSQKQPETGLGMNEKVRVVMKVDLGGLIDVPKNIGPCAIFNASVIEVMKTASDKLRGFNLFDQMSAGRIREGMLQALKVNDEYFEIERRDIPFMWKCMESCGLPFENNVIACRVMKMLLDALEPEIQKKP